MGRRTQIAVVIVVLSLIAASCTPSDETVETTTTSIPEVGPPSPPEIIPLLSTGSDTDAVYGNLQFFTSQVISDKPVTRLELLANGEIVDSVDFDEPVTDPPFAWEWTPASVGMHAMVVRAYDESGASADSFPSWLRVQPGTDVVTGEVRTGLPESSSAATVAVDVSSCEATLTVPAVSNRLGQYVVGSMFGVADNRAIDVVSADGGEVVFEVTSSPTLVSVVSYDEAVATPESQVVVPGSPECASGAWEGAVAFDGALLVGGEDLDAAYAYVTEDDATWWRIPESGFAPRGPGGFDFSGLLPAVGAGEHLEVEAWGRKDGGLVGLGRGRFTTTEDGPIEGTIGLAQPVTPFSDLKIVDHVTSGADLSSLVEILLNEQTVCAEGSPGAATYCPGGGGMAPHIVRWNKGILGAKAGMVQVSSQPPPKDAALDFPGLLWAVDVLMGDDQQRDIELPLDDIRDGSWLSDEARAAGPPSDGIKLDYGDYRTLQTDLEKLEASLSGTSRRMTEPIHGDWWSGAPHDRLWVRVVPLSDSQPIAGTSNTVMYQFQEGEEIVIDTGPGRIEDYYDLVVSFTPPVHGTPDPFSRCVRVIENPFGKENPVPSEMLNDFKDAPMASYWVSHWEAEYRKFRDNAGVWDAQGKHLTGLVPGATSCALHKDPPDPGLFDFIEAAISFIAKVWDTFKNIVDMVKNGIIEGIVDIVGCEPKETCVAALKALADAGLAAVGVPPTLPSFSEFVEAAKGNIAAALADQLVGDTCGPIPCADWAKTFVEDAIKDIETHFSKMTVSNINGNGGWYLYLNPEIVVVPEPAGQLFPGAVKVTFHPKPGVDLESPAAPKSCSVSLVTRGSGLLRWTDKHGFHHENDPVEGVVFATESVGADLSELKVGDALVVGVSGLDFERTQYLPDAHPQLGYSPDSDKLRSKALFTDPDTNFTMIANVCGREYTKTAPQDLHSTTPADIPTE